MSGQASCCHAAESKVRDPICGMSVDVASAKHRTEYEGKAFYFCCAGCKEKFDAEPDRYAQAAPTPMTMHQHASHTPAAAIPGAIYTCPMHPEVQQDGPGDCPKCGMALEPMMPSLDEDDAG